MKIIGLHLSYSLLIRRETVGLFFLLMLCFSCGKDKVIQLPEINHSDITEITDVSAAYLFYDETQTDSVELNRKNLISSTNWLINVDKRLTLKQAIPHIKFLQDKKENSSHKKESSKNYFTCNDLSRKSLGFVEFTNVTYHLYKSDSLFSEISDIPFFPNVQIEFCSKEEINLTMTQDEKIEKASNKTSLFNDLNKLIENQNIAVDLILVFNENLSFQDYIQYKSLIMPFESKSTFILQNEFISNY
jgi:hypothetical protein